MQRHFRNLKKLYPNCKINIYLPNKYNEHRIFDDDLNITFSNNLFKFYLIENIYYDIYQALNSQKYDAVFIGSLPPDRIDVAIEVVNKGFNLFIEKPLSHNLDKVYKLQEIVEEKKLKCGIGFQMRFSSVIQKIKQMVESMEFRNIYRIEVNHCNSIYNWTKGRNLKKDFYILSDNYGGLLLNQAVHEIDYLTYLFGTHYPISAIYGNILGFEVEDTISIMSNLETVGACIPIIINLDFLSSIPRRDITIHGMNKTQTFNLMSNNFVEWNNLFVEEMKAFIGLLEGKKDERLATLEDGISSLEYVMDIKDNFGKINEKNNSS